MSSRVFTGLAIGPQVAFLKARKFRIEEKSLDGHGVYRPRSINDSGEQCRRESTRVPGRTSHRRLFARPSQAAPHVTEPAKPADPHHRLVGFELYRLLRDRYA